MTKENEIYNKILKAMGGNVSTTSITLLQSILDEFFNSNICISKGDILQVYTEGWVDIFILMSNYEYRIKRPEPIFEWQYMYKNLLTNQYDITGYLSDDEYIESNNSWHKLEETKRERK
jgi:hypothetical protein